MNETADAAAFSALADARYVALATQKRDGQEVVTPVWIVGSGTDLYCYSAADAGKIKRIRREPRVRLAACDFRGGRRGAWTAASARLVANGAESEAVFALLRQKYGWQMRTADLLARLGGRHHQRAVIAFSGPA